MGFKINLFILVSFSMFNVIHICWSFSLPFPLLEECYQPYSSGPCFTEEMKINKTYERRYWYDMIETKDCNIFPYGGCGGNTNNYKSYEECLISCSEEHNAALKNVRFPRSYFLDPRSLKA